VRARSSSLTKHRRSPRPRKRPYPPGDRATAATSAAFPPSRHRGDIDSRGSRRQGRVDASIRGGRDVPDARPRRSGPLQTPGAIFPTRPQFSEPRPEVRQSHKEVLRTARAIFPTRPQLSWRLSDPRSGPPGGTDSGSEPAERRSGALRTARAIFSTRLQLTWRAPGALETPRGALRTPGSIFPTCPRPAQVVGGQGRQRLGLVVRGQAGRLCLLCVSGESDLSGSRRLPTPWERDLNGSARPVPRGWPTSMTRSVSVAAPSPALPPGNTPGPAPP
jgi:hypothetical protein